MGGGVTLIWEQGRKDRIQIGRSQRVPYGGGQFGWHTDLVHEGTYRSWHYTHGYQYRPEA